MKAYTESLFDTNSVEIVANETMTEPVATCPRAQYLLKRDNVAAAAHLEIMEQMKQFQGEIQDVLGLNASNIYDLVGFAKYSALGGRYPGLSDAAHQWFSTFHSHFSTNLMVGVFDQGKMLTYELLSDIMTQIEDWTPFSLYIVTKETYIALLKILTLYSGQVNWGDSLTMAVTRSPDSEISLTFFIQDTPLDNEYCGSPCILATFMEKMRGKRMYASRALFRKACEYLGDEDLSWKKYYLMVGAMVGIILMFKGSDWLVRKTAPKPKKE